MTRFDLDLAFSRNLGWLTEQEQAILRHKRVAIAGLGGVGGAHLLTLTRLGVGAFTIADFDRFELANFNRQAGAGLSHLGQKKIEVLSAAARDINPEMALRTFPEGVTENNVDDFLEGADVYVDGLDFFELDARRLIFRRCAKRRIPAVTVAPLGMGASLLNFLPGGMSFDDYFRMEGKDKTDDLIRFLIGLAPRMLQMRYLVDDSYADFQVRRGPSTAMGCQLSAGIAATEVLKILLGRGGVIPAPRGVHFDAYRNRLVRTWRPGGNRHPLQRLAFRLAKRKLASKGDGDRRRENRDPLPTPAERVIDLARWAPSGDNLQRWRFKVLGDREIEVFEDNHSRDVYFLNDWPKLLALGGLLETIAIAATGEGCKAVIRRSLSGADGGRQILHHVRLKDWPGAVPSPLLPFVKTRTTQRRALSKIPLTHGERLSLEESVAPYRILWLDSPRQRRRMASLSSQYAKIRLTIPEAYDVHKRIVQWNARFSEDRIPDRAIGLGPLGLKLMRWAMKSWGRVNFMNRYLAGTLLPRLQLEVIPGRNAAAYVALLAPRPPRETEDYLEAGRKMQRFWLTLTRLGLQFQPQMAPLIFDSYVREKIAFTTRRAALQKAASLSPRLREVLGETHYPLTAFLGRIGRGRYPESRSLRRPLDQLRQEPRK